MVVAKFFLKFIKNLLFDLLLRNGCVNNIVIQDAERITLIFWFLKYTQFIFQAPHNLFNIDDFLSALILGAKVLIAWLLAGSINSLPRKWLRNWR